MTNDEELTASDRAQIEEILSRRANEVAQYCDEYRRKPDHLGSIELALSREIERLRELADKVNPPEPEDAE